MRFFISLIDTESDAAGTYRRAQGVVALPERLQNINKFLEDVNDELLRREYNTNFLDEENSALVGMALREKEPRLLSNANTFVTKVAYTAGK